MGMAMNFLAEYRAGQATAQEIEQRVAEWHDADPGTPAARVDLHEYLGMTWEQYTRWASKGELPQA